MYTCSQIFLQTESRQSVFMRMRSYPKLVTLVGMSLGGYDASFLSPVSKDLECPVCLLVLRDPLQTSCGHLFCKKCVDNMTRSQSVRSCITTQCLAVAFVSRNSQFRCPLDKRLCKRSEVSLGVVLSFCLFWVIVCFCFLGEGVS